MSTRSLVLTLAMFVAGVGCVPQPDATARETVDPPHDVDPPDDVDVPSL